jgi:hypothetical protein
MPSPYAGSKKRGLPYLYIQQKEQVEDPVVQAALRTIEMWGNSLGPFISLSGFSSAVLAGQSLNGNTNSTFLAQAEYFNGVTTDANGLYQVTFPEAFSTSLAWVFLQDISSTSSANQELVLDSLNPPTLAGFHARFIVNAAPYASSPVSFMYLALGQA